MQHQKNFFCQINTVGEISKANSRSIFQLMLVLLIDWLKKTKFSSKCLYLSSPSYDISSSVVGSMFLFIFFRLIYWFGSICGSQFSLIRVWVVEFCNVFALVFGGDSWRQRTSPVWMYCWTSPRRWATCWAVRGFWCWRPCSIYPGFWAWIKLYRARWMGSRETASTGRGNGPKHHPHQRDDVRSTGTHQTIWRRVSPDATSNRLFLGACGVGAEKIVPGRTGKHSGKSRNDFPHFFLIFSIFWFNFSFY